VGMTLGLVQYVLGAKRLGQAGLMQPNTSSVAAAQAPVANPGATWARVLGVIVAGAAVLWALWDYKDLVILGGARNTEATAWLLTLDAVGEEAYVCVPTCFVAHPMPAQSSGGFGCSHVRAARPPRGLTRGRWYRRSARRGTACLPLDLLSCLLGDLLDLVLPTGLLRRLGIAPCRLRCATVRAESRLCDVRAAHDAKGHAASLAHAAEGLSPLLHVP